MEEDQFRMATKKEQKKPAKKPKTKAAAKAKKVTASPKKTKAPAKKTAAPKKKAGAPAKKTAAPKKRAAATTSKAAAPKKPAAAKPPKALKSFSVSEFAAMTYLTEKGVRQWLQQGLLKGRQDAKGNWQIEASNLEVPNVKRLVR
jgi:outer membrane biosynthesis protein TonB